MTKTKTKPVKAASKKAAPQTAPVKADPAMFSDCGETPCPEPMVPAATPDERRQMTADVRMRDNPAEWAFVRLSKLVEEFESKLDKDDEVGVRLVGAPGDATLQIDDIGFWGPDMILFFGKNPDGKPVRLIQHYTQVNLLLDARKKPEARPARRIGFNLAEMVKSTNPKS